MNVVRTSGMQKIALVSFGIVLCIVFLEIGLRTAGFLYLITVEYRNRPRPVRAGECRIVCMGESTTVWGGENSWPAQLERILNEGSQQGRFKVFNKGRHAVDSSYLISILDDVIARYNPHIVITMMGINDGDQTVAFEEAFSPGAGVFFRGMRVYKLARLLQLHIFSKIAELKSSRKGRDEFAPSSGEKDGIVIVESLMEQGKFAEAEEYLARMLEQGLDTDSANLYLGYLYLRQGRYKDAEEKLSKVNETGRRGESALVLLGKLNTYQKKYREAERILKRAIELYPRRSTPYTELCFCYRDAKDGSIDVHAAKIEKLLLEAIGKVPESDCRALYLELANLYRSESRGQEARLIYEKLFAVWPDYSSAYELMRQYEAEREYKKIDELMERASSLPHVSKNERLCGLLAVFYQQKGDVKKANKFFKAALHQRLRYYYPATRANYQRLQEITAQRGIRLVCVQYPMRSVVPLKKLFDSTDGLIFVDNEASFKKAVAGGRYKDYFEDNFAGDFGHCTARGNRLLAENIARAIRNECCK